MSPAGGYKPINYQRIPAKKLLGGKKSQKKIITLKMCSF